jgi:hypothetical protein
MYVGSTYEMIMAGTTVTIKMAKNRYGSSGLELPGLSERERGI